MRVFLDCMIFDLLEADALARERLLERISSGHVEVIVTPKLIDELSKSPFKGVPKWLPTTYRREAVSVLDHMFWDQSFLTKGETYSAHRGVSNKVADAIHAESASRYADVFISEDDRARRRLISLTNTCRCMTFSQFRTEILGLF